MTSLFLQEEVDILASEIRCELPAGNRNSDIRALIPRALCLLNNDLWLARSNSLYRYDIHGGEVLDIINFNSAVGTDGICSDGNYLYVMNSGNVMGRTIYVIDPSSCKVINQLLTIRNGKRHLRACFGMCYNEDYLYALTRIPGSAERSVVSINPESGSIISRISLELDHLDDRSVFGLNRSGDYFISMEYGRESGSVCTLLHYFDIQTGHHEGSVTVDFAASALHCNDSDLNVLENSTLRNIGFESIDSDAEQFATIHNLENIYN